MIKQYRIHVWGSTSTVIFVRLLPRFWGAIYSMQTLPQHWLFEETCRLDPEEQSHRIRCTAINIVQTTNGIRIPVYKIWFVKRRFGEESVESFIAGTALSLWLTSDDVQRVFIGKNDEKNRKWKSAKEQRAKPIRRTKGLLVQNASALHPSNSDWAPPLQLYPTQPRPKTPLYEVLV